MLLQGEKREKHLITMINATVSHEIRNAINAINASVIFLKALLSKIHSYFEKAPAQITDSDSFRKKV